MNLFDFFRSKKAGKEAEKQAFLSEKDLRWNRFIEEICVDGDLSSLSEKQRIAALCFWYDSEMQNGGFSQYQDSYPDTDPNELKEALATVGNEEIVRNYCKALEEGEQDDWVETDAEYGSFSPTLCELLQEYVEKNKDEILEN